MSEFVECQNCGRKFFAENIDCPYCSREQEERERILAARGGSGTGAMYGVLFSSFMIVLAGIAAISFVLMPRTRPGSMRQILALESLLAVATLIGLAQKRRWGRLLAILFILGNAAIGIIAIVQRGQGRSLAWGPGPAAMLLFLLPFLSAQARERFKR